MTEPVRGPDELSALRRYFLLRYREEVRRNYPVFDSLFPLLGASRLDLVRINGGVRVHFLYSRAREAGHLVVVHDLAMGGGSPQEEVSHVRRALHRNDALVHFVVEPPFLERFEHVEAEAVAAVRRHARLAPGPS